MFGQPLGPRVKAAEGTAQAAAALTRGQVGLRATRDFGKYRTTGHEWKP